MDFEDAKHYFSFMQICKVNDDYLYSYVECPNLYENIYIVTIDKPGQYTFSVTQKDARLLKKDSGYKYSYSQLFILKPTIGTDEMKYVNGNAASSNRDTYLECQLEEGQYVLISQVQWLQETEDKSFVITCYGVS